MTRDWREPQRGCRVSARGGQRSLSGQRPSCLPECLVWSGLILLVSSKVDVTEPGAPVESLPETEKMDGGRRRFRPCTLL